jgi:uncharacterized protein YqeY
MRKNPRNGSRLLSVAVTRETLREVFLAEGGREEEMADVVLEEFDTVAKYLPEFVTADALNTLVVGALAGYVHDDDLLMLLQEVIG